MYELCREKEVMGCQAAGPAYATARQHGLCLHGDLTERTALPICEFLNLPCASRLRLVIYGGGGAWGGGVLALENWIILSFC